MPDGRMPDRIVWDEVGDTRPRREVVVQREDGSTYSAEFPADTDLGSVLGAGEVVAHDAGAEHER